MQPRFDCLELIFVKQRNIQCKLKQSRSLRNSHFEASNSHELKCVLSNLRYGTSDLSTLETRDTRTILQFLYFAGFTLSRYIPISSHELHSPKTNTKSEVSGNVTRLKFEFKFVLVVQSKLARSLITVTSLQQTVYSTLNFAVVEKDSNICL